VAPQDQLIHGADRFSRRHRRSGRLAQLAAGLWSAGPGGFRKTTGVFIWPAI
jgi:uncharacterized cupin superfamily protein